MVCALTKMNSSPRLVCHFLNQMSTFLHPSARWKQTLIMSRWNSGWVSYMAPRRLWCLSADSRAQGGLAGVQLGPGCGWALHLHRSGPWTEPLLQRCQEQAASAASGEGVRLKRPRGPACGVPHARWCSGDEGTPCLSFRVMNVSPTAELYAHGGVNMVSWSGNKPPTQ